MSRETDSEGTGRDWTYLDIFVVLGLVFFWAPVVGYTFTMPDAAVSPWPDGTIRHPSYSVSIALCAQILLLPFWIGWYIARMGRDELNVTASFLRVVGTVVLWSVLVVVGSAARLSLALPSWQRDEIIEFACRYGIVESAGDDAASVVSLPGFAELDCGSVTPIARTSSGAADSGDHHAVGTRSVAEYEAGRFDVLPGAPRFEPAVVLTASGHTVLVFSTVGQALDWCPDAYGNARPVSAHELSTVLLWRSSGWEREVRMAVYWTMMTMGPLMLLLSAMWFIKLIVDGEARLRLGE